MISAKHEGNQYLAIIVEVWVEPDCTVSCGLQVDQWGRVGVILWEVDVKLKAAIGIRRVRGAGD